MEHVCRICLYQRLRSKQLSQALNIEHKFLDNHLTLSCVACCWRSCCFILENLVFLTVILASRRRQILITLSSTQSINKHNCCLTKAYNRLIWTRLIMQQHKLAGCPHYSLPKISALIVFSYTTHNTHICSQPFT